MVLCVRNPNGVEGAEQNRFFWLGGGPAVIDFLSFADTVAILKMGLLLGPSIPGLDCRHLAIASSGAELRFVVGEGLQSLRIPAVRGLNRITVAVEDQPTFFLPYDRRPLLLRVSDLRIEREGRNPPER
jgi:hypothetical protein